MAKKIKNLDVKFKDRKETPEVKERIQDVFNTETRHAIIMAINTFGSSNIKRLAKLLGKNESTIYHHIQELLKSPELIQIDTETTRSKTGIYYKLTKLSIDKFCDAPPEIAEDMFTQLYNVIETKSDEETAEFYYNLMAKNPRIGETAQEDRRRLSYNRILENFMISNLKNLEKSILNGEKPSNLRYPIGAISISSLDMRISTPRHQFEILKIISEMFGKISRLQKKFDEEMKEKKIPEEEQIAYHLHLVGGEVAEFKFSKEKK